ncbi:hypothetical protein ACFVYE_41750 [Streptomyces sp. NPDC058239]|uniref:hypothetical protein n=1 Tax=Streptomyces sp. NPDC058239 TaxID=3346395 RepID=UPI0036ECBC69
MNTRRHLRRAFVLAALPVGAILVVGTSGARAVDGDFAATIRQDRRIDQTDDPTAPPTGLADAIRESKKADGREAPAPAKAPGVTMADEIRDAKKRPLPEDSPDPARQAHEELNRVTDENPAKRAKEMPDITCNEDGDLVITDSAGHVTHNGTGDICISNPDGRQRIDIDCVTHNGVGDILIGDGCRDVDVECINTAGGGINYSNRLDCGPGRFDSTNDGRVPEDCTGDLDVGEVNQNGSGGVFVSNRFNGRPNDARPGVNFRCGDDPRAPENDGADDSARGCDTHGQNCPPRSRCNNTAGGGINFGNIYYACTDTGEPETAVDSGNPVGDDGPAPGSGPVGGPVPFPVPPVPFPGPFPAPFFPGGGPSPWSDNDPGGNGNPNDPDSASDSDPDPDTADKGSDPNNTGSQTDPDNPSADEGADPSGDPVIVVEDHDDDDRRVEESPSEEPLADPQSEVPATEPEADVPDPGDPQTTPVADGDEHDEPVTDDSRPQEQDAVPVTDDSRPQEQDAVPVTEEDAPAAEPEAGQPSGQQDESEEPETGVQDPQESQQPVPHSPDQTVGEQTPDDSRDAQQPDEAKESAPDPADQSSDGQAPEKPEESHDSDDRTLEVSDSGEEGDQESDDRAAEEPAESEDGADDHENDSPALLNQSAAVSIGESQEESSDSEE